MTTINKELTLARVAVEQWNETYPVGHPVTVRLDNGKMTETTTRSEAGMAGDIAVIMLVGISGCYRLDRVQPRPANEVRP